LERDVQELELIASKAKRTVIKSVSRRPDKSLRESINGFMEFFSIMPVSLDPFGIMKKLDHIIKNSERRFKYFVNQIAPAFSKEKKMNLKSALSGAIATYQIAKIIRHYFEIIKKYKIFQLALLLQMQIPLIKSIARASASATKAFVNGLPIGDSIGPLVAAKLIPKNARVKRFEEEEFICSEVMIDGKRVWIAKALGPGATTGFPGKFLEKFFKKQKIDRIITVDAAAKLEGEKTGSIAEGVGVAMGGIGVE
jgi:hypothetical protein